MEQNLVIKLKGLDCPHCAQKIENDAKRLAELRNPTINLIRQELIAEISPQINKEKVTEKIKEIVHKYEPDVEVFEEEKKGIQFKIKLKGLDCPHCVGEIEEGTKKLKGIENVSVNLMKQEMTINLQDTIKKQEIFHDIEKLVHFHEPDVEVNWIDETKKEEDTEDFQKELKKRISFYAVGIVLFLGAAVGLFETTFSSILYLVSYFIFGFDVLKNAVRNILKGQVFDENFLMSISTIGAIAIGELSEAVFVMLFYQIGETFQQIAVNRSRKSIKELMNIRPDFANLETAEGLVEVSPEDVEINDFIVVKPGEKVPLDGVVIEGSSQIDTSALTGESVPRGIAEGQEILSGSINITGILKIKVTKGFGESTVVKILELVENATTKKSKTEQFITKFARVYTPIVVIAAVMLAFLPPIFTAEADLSMWVGRALIFLVISCPCALVLSVPLGFFSGIGEAGKKGVLVKGSNYIHALSEARIVVFDKTGTLTKGVFEVTQIKAEKEIEEKELLKLTAMAESMSNHPIAKSIVARYELNFGSLEQIELEQYEEIGGHGIQVKIHEKQVTVGNKRLMDREKIHCEVYDGIGSVVYIAIDGSYAGRIVVSDSIKSTSKEAIQRLKKLGVQKTIMLTGDNHSTAQKISKELGLDEYYGELLPQDKVELIEKIACSNEKGKILFVGDGINDAPVLARADIGIAMGGVGSDAAIEAADVVIMNDDLAKIADGIIIARNTNKIVNQNIVFALTVKVIVLALGAIGFATMWMAVFADVGVAFIAILNSMRKKIK